MGIAYSECRTFEIADMSDVVTGGCTIDGNTFVAICMGRVNNTVGVPPTATGICYMQGIGTPNINSLKVETSDANIDISVMLAVLAENATYTYRAFSTNSRGTSYCVAKTFHMPNKKPTVSTGSYLLTSYTSATCKGAVDDIVAVPPSETGICFMSGYGTPSINNSKVQTQNASSNISVNLTNLNAGGIYSYRAYASNKFGTSYGDVCQFQLDDGNKPVVKTLADWEASPYMVHLKGLITSRGASAITEKGICYIVGTTGLPTIYDETMPDRFLQDDSILGRYSHGFYYSDFRVGNTIRYRAYATNSYGTSYGEVRTFSTGNASVSFDHLCII